jgi:hypothetical protein
MILTQFYPFGGALAIIDSIALALLFCLALQEIRRHVSPSRHGRPPKRRGCPDTGCVFCAPVHNSPRVIVKRSMQYAEAFDYGGRY